MRNILNLNVGVLGHVDSGKTSLAKVLSTTASTASFDKNPQSQERGITIDLGFSSFVVDIPEGLKSAADYEKLQFTLVDCPGHASLIRTIIGGAQIIDIMLLVIDVTKGVQTQTAECLIIGQITCNKMIIVLNKIDLLPKDKRDVMIQKMAKKLKITLSNTIFSDSPIVSVAAKCEGADSKEIKSEGIEELIKCMQSCAFLPDRHSSHPFLFAVDHCFSIRGQGTIMTGTVLQGTVCVNDTIEIPAIHSTRKVKSLQMFRQPIESAAQGDRLGISVTHFDPKQLERGLICASGYISAISAAIISIKKIKYFKGKVQTKSKFHVSMGHETVMAKITVFGLMRCDSQNEKYDSEVNRLEFDQIYKYSDELYPEELSDNEQITEKEVPIRQYALLEFERPVLVVPRCLIIGSKLEIDAHANTCRIAFQGQLLEGIEDKNYTTSVLPNLKVYKTKSRCGVVERVANEYEVIGRNIFKKETNIQAFVGLKVTLSTGEEGVIESSFGQSGKVKIRIPGGLNESTKTTLLNATKKRGKPSSTDTESVEIVLTFKRYIYDPQKKMIQ